MVGGLVLGALAVLTIRQSEVWSSDERVWRASETVRAHANHRDALWAAGQWQDAIQECDWLRQAVTLGLTTPTQAVDIGRRCVAPSR